MRAGRLRKVVTIEAPTTANSSTGEPQDTWASIANGSNIFADIDEDPPGTEKIQAAQVNAQKPIRVTIRYLASVTPKCRVTFGSRTFQIAGVQNMDQRNRMLVLSCLENV